MSATDSAHGTTRSISSKNSRLRVRLVLRCRPRSACFIAEFNVDFMQLPPARIGPIDAELPEAVAPPRCRRATRTDRKEAQQWMTQTDAGSRAWTPGSWPTLASRAAICLVFMPNPPALRPTAKLGVCWLVASAKLCLSAEKRYEKLIPCFEARSIQTGPERAGHANHCADAKLRRDPATGVSKEPGRPRTTMTGTSASTF